MIAGDASQRRMRLIPFKRMPTGALKGFATVELPVGLVLEECPVFVSGDRIWASLPSKPVISRDGRQSEVGGKRQYAPIARWRDRDLADHFSEAVVGLVRATNPNALDEEVSS
ncbi:MAG: hypothetical protein WA417_09460 [Stellaceae bacterium]